MKYLNLGCGVHYSTLKEWVNIDFVSNSPNVSAHNLLEGIPFEDASFDLVYHSHVLEHFSKKDGEMLIRECFRVLKPNGILRIAVPDLEAIVRSYLSFLEEGLQKPEDETVNANYEWTMLELYDQSLRNYRGGDMGKFLENENLKNENYIFNRTGEEGVSYRNNFLKNKDLNKESDLRKEGLLFKLKQIIKSNLFKTLNFDQNAHEIGKFRLSGEIHQWMYDRYSLKTLLSKNRFNQIEIKDAYTSYISNWSQYELDGTNVIVFKPISLFIEGIKHD